MVGVDLHLRRRYDITPIALECTARRVDHGVLFHPEVTRSLAGFLLLCRLLLLLATEGQSRSRERLWEAADAFVAGLHPLRHLLDDSVDLLGAIVGVKDGDEVEEHLVILAEASGPKRQEE